MKPDPYFSEDGITIYLGDCREILPHLPKVDALVTDPPYGIGWGRASWEDDPGAYPELMRWLVGQSAEKVNGWCFIFQAMLNAGHFHEWFPEGWRIFAACKNFAQIRPTAVWHSWDPVIFWNTTPNTTPNSSTVNRDFHVGNVAGVFGEGNDHPCPRPIDTMRHIVAIAAPKGGLICDPFSGSGTTLLAAKQLGRRAIGVEIERRYCDIAIERLKQKVLPLTVEPQPEAVRLPEAT